MAYRVDKFNGTFLASVDDGTIDTTTDIRFVGKNYAGYGEVQNENFLHLLENFANTSAPPKAIAGQIWYDSTNKKLKFYDGTQFRSGSGAEVSATAPAGLSTGDFWFDSSADQLYVWSGTEFILVGPESTPELGNTTFLGQIVKDDQGSNRTLGRLIIGDQTVAIVSKESFTLDSSLNPIAGFTYVQAGITLINSATGVTNPPHKFYGTASNADALEGFTADDFVKAGNESFNTIVSFEDSGFTVGGIEKDLLIEVTNGDDASLINQLGKPIFMKVKVGAQDIRIPAQFTSSSVEPGTTNFYNLGGANNTWKSVYATDFVGNLTGNVTGDTTGSHKGNIRANDNTLMLDAATKTFNGSFTGTLTGTVIGELVGTANNAVTLGGLSADTSAIADTVALRDSSGNVTANQFEGTADKTDRMKIADAANDSDPDYRSAKTTASALTIAARNSSGDLFANIFRGTATSARFADLAEIYSTEKELAVGTIVSVCAHEDYEVCEAMHTDMPIGVISAEPAYLMNSEAEGQAIALKGRVPVRINGPVKKGDKVFLDGNGVGTSVNNGELVGIALESNPVIEEKLVECVLKV